MPVNLIQPSFAAGEIDPALYSRVDLAKYHIGARTMLNWYALSKGGASNRPGTGWVGEVIDSAKVGRLIPFQFSTSQTYVLEFSDLKMRVITGGGYVTETAKVITGITKANPGKVTTSTSHGFVTGDRVYLAAIVGMTQLNARYVDITVTSATEFTVGIDTTGYTTYGSAGTAARLYTLTTPYATANLPNLKYEQSADTMTLTHRNYAPRKLTRTGNASWTLSTIVFAPTQTAPVNVLSSAGGTAQYYAVTAINDDSGEESLQSADAGSSGLTSALTFSALAGCSSYNIYRKKNGVYGFIGSAQTSSSSSTVTFTDATIDPNTTLTPPQQRNPFSSGSFASVTIAAAGVGYVAPSGRLIDSGVTVTTITLAVDGSGHITSATPASTGQRISSAAYIEISDGAGAGCTLQLNFTADGGTLWVANDGNGDPIFVPTYVISSVTVLAGGTGYHAGALVHSLYHGTVDDGGPSFSVTVGAGIVTAVGLVSAGTGRYVDWPSYGFPTAYITDSTGTGASLTPVSTSDATVYPGNTTYADGRQWYASSSQKPQTLWGSVSGSYNSMAVSVPTQDNDAITRTLASRQVNEIRHMVSMGNGLIVFTSGAEWKISAGSADVITPAQFVARPQSYNGSSDIRPIVVNDMILYIPDNQRKVRGLQYQWAADTWSGPDFSLLSAHLFEASGSNTNQIVNWQYARDPEGIIWTVRDDGVLLGFTFQAEQQVFAWHRHTTTNGTFEDVCVVQESDESAVYFIVKRTIGGVTRRFVERLHTRVFATISDAWFLDCALQYSGAAATVISGLWHLVGEEVYALADGIVRGPFTVSAAGAITLAVAAAKVTVGKVIPDADLETLDAEKEDQAGTLQGRKKKINHNIVSLKNSANAGLKAGPSGGLGTPVLYAFKPKDIANPLASAPSTAPALITDFMQQVAAPSWDWHGRTLIRVSASPLPYTVIGYMYDLSAGS